MEVCEPRFATRRRPERPTRADELLRISRLLGTPLMPWQYMVAEVGLELKEVNGIWVPAHRECVVTIPRQCGKTTLVLSWELHRCVLWGKPQRVAYTAQTGQDARKKMLEDQLPMIERSDLASGIARVRRSQGAEGIDFVGGSQLDVLASTESAGHGRTLDLGVIDEAFRDEDDRREQAMLPAMTTRKDAQLLVVSTMGTDSSTYLNRKVDAGRDHALNDRDDDEIAYFEWSAHPDADIDDPETWKSCMPAFGPGGTIDERAVKHARATMTEGEFRRAYLNQRTVTEDRIIPQDVWNAVCGDVFVDGRLFFAIDCNPERSSSAIAVADGTGKCEMIAHDQGTGWLVAQVVEKAKRWGNATVAYDPAGPAGVFGDEVAKHGIPTVAISGRELAHACSHFYDGVIDKSIGVRSNGSLDAAVAAARKRISGDAWIWARRDASADLSPLVAATLALFAAHRGIDPVANVW
jgi:hypothetical protein